MSWEHCSQHCSFSDMQASAWQLTPYLRVPPPLFSQASLSTPRQANLLLLGTTRRRQDGWLWPYGPVEATRYLCFQEITTQVQSLKHCALFRNLDEGQSLETPKVLMHHYQNPFEFISNLTFLFLSVGWKNWNYRMNEVSWNVYLISAFLHHCCGCDSRKCPLTYLLCKYSMPMRYGRDVLETWTEFFHWHPCCKRRWVSIEMFCPQLQ